jgi:hypothetical protein
MFFTLTGTNLDAPDANALAAFYRQLLGWTAVVDDPGWVVLRPPGGGFTLNFQTESRYVRPARQPNRIREPATRLDPCGVVVAGVVLGGKDHPHLAGGE